MTYKRARNMCYSNGFGYGHAPYSSAINYYSHRPLKGCSRGFFMGEAGPSLRSLQSARRQFYFQTNGTVARSSGTTNTFILSNDVKRIRPT